MPPEISAEAWAQIRHDYEHTGRPVDDICAEHGISTGTLRDRMRRWGWTRRRLPIGAGPPPLIMPAPTTAPTPATASDIAPSGIAPPPAPAASADEAARYGDIPPYGPAAWGPYAGHEPAAGDGAIVPRLQSAVVRVLAAVEATVARLGAAPLHAYEMERAARALVALTRALRELNDLLRA
jgi:transposase-like protein